MNETLQMQVPIVGAESLRCYHALVRTFDCMLTSIFFFTTGVLCVEVVLLNTQISLKVKCGIMTSD